MRASRIHLFKTTQGKGRSLSDSPLDLSYGLDRNNDEQDDGGCVDKCQLTSKGNIPGTPVPALKGTIILDPSLKREEKCERRKSPADIVFQGWARLQVSAAVNMQILATVKEVHSSRKMTIRPDHGVFSQLGDTDGLDYGYLSGK